MMYISIRFLEDWGGLKKGDGYLLHPQGNNCFSIKTDKGTMTVDINQLQADGVISIRMG